MNRLVKQFREVRKAVLPFDPPGPLVKVSNALCPACSSPLYFDKPVLVCPNCTCFKVTPAHRKAGA